MKLPRIIFPIKRNVKNRKRGKPLACLGFRFNFRLLSGVMGEGEEAHKSNVLARASECARLIIIHNSGPSIVPACASRKRRHYYFGHRHYSACRHDSLFPSVPNDFTGIIVGNHHCPTDSIEALLLYAEIARS